MIGLVRASGLSVVLWTVFVVITAACGFALLPACGLLLPLAVTWPGSSLNFCPKTLLTLSAEADRGATLKRLANQLELKLAQKNLACADIPPPPLPPLELPAHAGQARPQQTALFKPPPPPAPKPAPLDSERWSNKDLTLLNGCWQLGREGTTNWTTNGVTEWCRVPAGRICFGQDGTGRREMNMICPRAGAITCSAPITATFGSDGTLGTTQPVVTCSDGHNTWFARQNWLTCTRVSDTVALCRSTYYRPPFEYEFRR